MINKCRTINKSMELHELLPNDMDNGLINRFSKLIQYEQNNGPDDLVIRTFLMFQEGGSEY